MAEPSPPSPTPAKDPARARFAAITLIRMSGAALVLIGILITRGRIDLPWWIGLILTLVGVFDVFAMPLILARKWKTPK